MNAWVAIVAVLTVLMTALGTLRWYQLAHKPHPEVVRKLLHIIMGGIAVTFPWVFSEAWPVWLLAGLSALTLISIKYFPPWRSSLGNVVCSVKRKTYGEICFPLSVAILFSVAHTQPLLYCIPMAILSIADASSALIGIFFGKHKYSTADGNKTAEGSITFFIVASLSTALPLLALGIDPAHAVLISLLLGCLVTLFEAIAWQGLDNLFIPLSAYALLQAGLQTHVAILMQQLLVASTLLIAAIAWRRRTTLNDSAALGAGLFTYLSWTIGGWEWALAPLTVLVFHRLILPAKYRRRETRPQTIHEVIWVASLGFVWLWVSKVTDQSLLLPYTLTYAAHLAAIGCAHAALPQAHSLKLHALVQSCVSAWLALFIPYLLMAGLAQPAIIASLWSLVAMLVCAAAFLDVFRAEETTFHSLHRWARQTGLVALSSVIVFGLSYLG